jgi:hypothetical protein
MEDSYEQAHQLRALAMRVAALEDNVAFLEQWCEEQQDSLDRAVGSIAYDYEVDESDRPPRTVLRVVDLRDGDDSAEDGAAGTIVALVDTEHDRAVHLIRARLNRLRAAWPLRWRRRPNRRRSTPACRRRRSRRARNSA